MSEELELHNPTLLKRVLARFKIREVRPEDISDNLELFRSIYPTIFGDIRAIGPGDDGGCQDWNRDYEWHERFLREQKCRER